MKGILIVLGLIFLLASSVTLYAETYKIDGSSNESFKRSISRISKSLDNEQKKQFAVAFLTLRLSGINSAAEFKENADKLKGETSQELIKILDGLTYEDVIELARTSGGVRAVLPGGINDNSVRSQESKSDTGHKKKTRLVRPVPELQYDSLTPVEIDEPRWPSSALINGQNGWVSLELQIDVEGIPVDVSVVDSSPSKLFDKTALKSIKKWRFELPENHSADNRYSYLMEFKVLGEENDGSIDPEFKGDIEGLSNSTLRINHTEIESIDDERISVSIDYKLEPFHEGDRIYGCAFIYIDSENKPQAITHSPDEVCHLTKQADRTIIYSPLPDDYELQLMKGKLTFYVMVLQRVDGSLYKKIGQTKYLYHKFSGFDGIDKLTP